MHGEKCRPDKIMLRALTFSIKNVLNASVDLILSSKRFDGPLKDN